VEIVPYRNFELETLNFKPGIIFNIRYLKPSHPNLKPGI
jgi:hypothetical protein